MAPGPFDYDRHGGHHRHHGCVTPQSSLGRFVLTRHMEAQDFGDFFEHINPDTPQFLSMLSYCDLLRDLQPQAHAHG